MLLESKKPEIGMSCPDFLMPSVDGGDYRLNSFQKSKALLVTFICRHCPYVLAIEDRLLSLAHSFKTEQLQTVAICSNDWKSYPEDSPANLLKRSEEKNYNFPYLVDETQAVAKSFDAVCTPEFYLFDQGRKLFYHGRLDDNWQHPDKVTKEDLNLAVKSLLEGNSSPENQLPSMGCSIKWR